MKVFSKEKKLWFGLLAGIAMVMCSLVYLMATHAEGSLGLYTPTPGINVTAGDSVSFALYLTGSEAIGKNITLSIDSMPDGFTGYFKSGNYEVTKVHADGSKDTAAATLQVSIPTEAADGNNKIVVKAVSDDGIEDYLTLDLNISELKSGESNFTVEYPDQEGVSGTSFSYSTTIANNSLNTQNYNFSTDAPSGWTVTFTSDDKQVSSLDVESGDSAGVTITVTPPTGVEAGDYKISCAATSAKENLSTDLNVTILGTYSMDVTTVDGNLALDAYANKTSDVTMVVKNTGNIDLKNIKLSSQANTNWKVEFDSSTIDELKAGASKEVKLHITPSSDSITGDYVTDISATCDNQSDMAELRVTVKTQTGWGIFAVVIICAVVAGLWGVVKKYGRR